MFRRRRFATLALVFAALAAAYGMSVRKPDAALAAPAVAPIEFLAADLHTVEVRTLVRTLPITGTLGAMTQATLKATVAGELIAVTAREGESVAKGEVLARIDPTEVRTRVAAREADVEAAQAQLAWAQKNRSMQQALLEKRFISQNAFDSVDSNYEVAAARLRAAQAELVLARKSLGDAALVAPFAGVVAERHAKAGERIAVDARVLTLVDLSRLELEAAVPATEIGRLRVGQAVEFRVEGMDERRFAGRIERISPATVAGSRSINVYAAIDNPDGALRAGMFAQGSAILEQAPNGIAIPASALHEEAGQAFVYALAEGRVVRKPVKAGAPDAAGFIQVIEGLVPGDRIVRANLGMLRENAAARIAGVDPALD